MRYCSVTMACARAETAASCSDGSIPSAGVLVTPWSIWTFSPATRTMKNSSRFEATIPRNFSRSAIGSDGSAASSSTRWLNSSQDSSRLMKRRGSSAARGSDDTGSGGAAARDGAGSTASPGSELVMETA